MKTDLDNLRKEVKHKLVDLDLDGKGGYRLLVPHLTVPASEKIISNAMTGYRRGPAAKALLEEMLALLSSWPPKNVPPSGGNIHEQDNQDN